jgi:hypothetical protein
MTYVTEETLSSAIIAVEAVKDDRQVKARIKTLVANEFIEKNTDLSKGTVLYEFPGLIDTIQSRQNKRIVGNVTQEQEERRLQPQLEQQQASQEQSAKEEFDNILKQNMESSE